MSCRSVATSRLEPSTNLHETETTTNAATLAWTNNAPTGGFELEYHLAGQPNFLGISSSLPADATSFTITGLGTGLTYTFRIRARSPMGAPHCQPTKWWWSCHDQTDNQTIAPRSLSLEANRIRASIES
ncbi:MAG: fibronectin type III domain-containing protein [bacterium]